MNINWVGKQEFLLPKQKDQLDLRFSKIGRLLEVDGKADKHARVALTHDRNMHRAEVTLNYLHHTLVGEHVDADQFIAMTMAVEKLERLLLKVRQKSRDVKKGPRESWDKGVAADFINGAPAEPETPDASESQNEKPRVYRVGPEEGKPLTLDEALLMIDNEPYMVYRTSESDHLAVLLRRPDGNFDLVEC